MVWHDTRAERVRAALDHREPDRVPVCVGGTGGKITESRIELLKRHFGISGRNAAECWSGRS